MRKYGSRILGVSSVAALMVMGMTNESHAIISVEISPSAINPTTSTTWNFSGDTSAVNGFVTNLNSNLRLGQVTDGFFLSDIGQIAVSGTASLSNTNGSRNITSIEAIWYLYKKADRAKWYTQAV